jgi:insertion element IS1 protein InsB
MILTPIECPGCQGVDMGKWGKSPEGKQRYHCRNPKCSYRTFLLDYSYNGRLPSVKAQIIEMTMNSSGIRDIARVLKISPTTVIEELKKRNQRSGVSM